MTNPSETYDREWTTGRSLPPAAQLRFGLSKERGTPVKFLVQLEYSHADVWLEVARFDHDSTDAYHNVEITGLHLDLYYPDDSAHTTKFATIRNWPPMPATDAMGEAEDFLRNNAVRYVRRFETWL